MGQAVGVGGGSEGGDALIPISGGMGQQGALVRGRRTRGEGGGKGRRELGVGGLGFRALIFFGPFLVCSVFVCVLLGSVHVVDLSSGMAEGDRV